MNNLDSLLFFTLFHRLKKQVLIELDYSQYADFLSCFLAHPPTDKESLLALCKLFWLTRPAYKNQLENLFEEEYQKLETSYLAFFRKQEITSVLKEGHIEKTLSGIIDDKKQGLPEQPGINGNPTHTPPEINQDAKQANAEEWVELLLNIEESCTGTGRIEQSPEQLSSKSIEYLFTDTKHLPFNHRKAIQSWRRYQGKSQLRNTYSLDLKQTVKKFSIENLITELEFKKERKSLQQLIWLSDHALDMVPFETWDNNLYEIVSGLSSFQSTRRFYFQCYPTEQRDSNDRVIDFQVFEDRGHTIGHSFKKALTSRKMEALVIIFSDGGAFQKKYEQVCLHSFYELYEMVKTDSSIFWFNPIEDWKGSTSGFLSLLLPMFPLLDRSFKEAVLHGK